MILQVGLLYTSTYLYENTETWDSAHTKNNAKSPKIQVERRVISDYRNLSPKCFQLHRYQINQHLSD